MDVETAYLYSNLQHEVFMTCTDGYIAQSSSPVDLCLENAITLVLDEIAKLRDEVED